MTTSLSRILVSPCERYHLAEEEPLYSKIFLKVLKYHEPGLAPVLSEEGAYHINLDGLPVYSQRFKETFGFYDGKAAVQSSEGWFHINPNGVAVYPERYAWVGNFQEEICSVRDFQGFYFHIDEVGNRLYSNLYTYVGDFKDGIAVVCHEYGHHTHIDQKGNFVHFQWFNQLDVFHKSFARAKDSRGWGHINKKGHFIYENRYISVEPFYNGLAHVVDSDERLLLINEEGVIVKVIHTPPSITQKINNDLSADMVGFWKTWTLYTAVQLKILDFLPDDLKGISDKMGIPSSKLKRLLRALWELDIVRPGASQMWELTEKGMLLKPADSSFLAAAGLMWGRVNKIWEDLPTLIQQPYEEYHSSFKEMETDDNWIKIYSRALDGYAERDFKLIAVLPFWKDHTSVLGFGRCSLTILSLLLKGHEHLKECSASESSAKADAILFPRFLHYFPDKEAISYLKKVQEKLSENGAIYIFEMLLDENSPMGGLFDLNMLAETGGKVRSLTEWNALLFSAGFKLTDIHEVSPILSVLRGEIL
jgi:hypothetical protein